MGRINPGQMIVCAAMVSAAMSALSTAASAGTWATLTNAFPAPEIVVNGTDYGPGGAQNPLLMTDGSVLIRNIGYNGIDTRVFKLTPDQNGSYVNGTWSEIAPMPYAAAGGSTAVLADGRVLFEGGEYSGPGFSFLLTNQGAAFDPATNTWTTVAPPAFFKDLFPPRRKFAPHPIGDSQNAILADGTFMIGDKMSRQAALLNPKTLKWTEVGTATKNDLNDEEGWTLLPNGKVLTTDCYTDFAFHLIPSYPADPTNSEIFDPATKTWSSAGSTVNTLTDPTVFETGPSILRPDGTVFFTGSQGYTSIYNTQTGTWSAGPALPMSPQGNRYSVQDGPAVLLPSGNVFFAATGGAFDAANGGYADPPVGFLEFNGTGYTAEPTIPNAANDMSGSVSLLLLPTGQVLAVDGTSDVEIYTPSPTKTNSAWAPTITGVSKSLTHGQSYKITGIRFNGMSQACAFGDELQCASNYPLVRITNIASGHVFYARTHNHSSMAVASPNSVTTTFDVPATQELGRSKLQVVANGIASAAVVVVIK